MSQCDPTVAVTHCSHLHVGCPPQCLGLHPECKPGYRLSAHSTDRTQCTLCHAMVTLYASPRTRHLKLQKPSTLAQDAVRMTFLQSALSTCGSYQRPARPAGSAAQCTSTPPDSQGLTLSKHQAFAQPAALRRACNRMFQHVRPERLCCVPRIRRTCRLVLLVLLSKHSGSWFLVLNTRGMQSGR